jgi:hypothetical protein
MEAMNNKQEKRRSTFAVLFYINRTKICQDGKCPLLCHNKQIQESLGFVTAKLVKMH